MNQCAHCGANHHNVLITNSIGNLFCQRCFKTQPKTEEHPFDKMFAMLTPQQREQYRNQMRTYGVAGIRNTERGPALIPLSELLPEPEPKPRRISKTPAAVA